MRVFGLWPTRVRVLVMKVEHGGSSTVLQSKMQGMYQRSTLFLFHELVSSL
ncbi:hypothetical protein V6N12_036283 [Hibiscus sabdariffa]|uniref:Uncharacterized protein n=1 Tax=Hibiscus sabdariffa TaxID=183260 RepID=A0ABR2ESP5_9ROSI